MSSDAALLQEIQRLSGAIDRHKLNESKPPYAPRFHQSRNYVSSATANRKYVNPAIAHKKYVNPAIGSPAGPSDGSAPKSSLIQHMPMSATRELVIGGVAFESSGRKLTRKDLITPRIESAGSSAAVSLSVNSSVTHAVPRHRGQYIRNSGNIGPSGRVHKPKYTKGKRLGGRNNMILDNVKGTRTGHISKRRKLDKQCRFFTLTGVCQRGLTCPYQHDPEKIAICSLFLSNSCPNSADTCHLSHDPTPCRVPFCHHFANHGRCTRENCPYPHVRVGPRSGVCRDFAVVGYCDMGIECDKQHVRECPDFAEKGICPNRVCKLPHVIRANRRRQAATSTSDSQPPIQPQTEVDSTCSRLKPKASAKEEYISVVPSVTENSEAAAEDYISLTFEESDDEDEEEEDISENNEDVEGSHDEKGTADGYTD